MAVGHILLVWRNGKIVSHLNCKALFVQPSSIRTIRATRLPQQVLLPPIPLGCIILRSMRYLVPIIMLTPTNQLSKRSTTIIKQEIAKSSTVVIIQASLLSGGFALRTVATATTSAMSARICLPATASRTAPLARRPASKYNHQFQ